MATMIKPSWDEVTTTYRRAVPLQPGNGEPLPEQYRSNGIENWHHHLRLMIWGRAFDTQEALPPPGFSPLDKSAQDWNTINP